MLDIETVGKTATVSPSRARSLHVIDIENLLGTTRSASEVRRVWNTYANGIGLGQNDSVIVASGPTLAKVAAFELSDFNLCYHIRSGIDGADNALLDQIDLSHVARRFEWLIVASGDGIFAPLMEQARSTGIKVWHVAGRGGVSKQIRSACALHSRLRLEPLAAATYGSLGLAA